MEESNVLLGVKLFNLIANGRSSYTFLSLCPGMLCRSKGLYAGLRKLTVWTLKWSRSCATRGD